MFNLSKKEVSTEIIAGFTTFLTMSYIIMVNPDILSRTGMDKTALIAVTAIVTGVITILTGIFTDTPVAMAPGMGLNAYFTYTVVMHYGVSWQIALGMVFISGTFFLILTLIGIREKVVDALPPELLSAIAVGIGIFITFIGLQNMHLVVENPATLVSAGKINGKVLISIISLLLMFLLFAKKIKGSLLIGIVFATIVGIMAGYVNLPESIFTRKINLSPITGKLDIVGALKLSLAGPIFAFMFVDMFDSIGTLLALGKEADLVDENGRMPKLGPLLTMDAAATMFGAVMGTSTTTSYIESAAGIESGGRTGLTSIVTGSLFLLSLLFVPVIAIVPSFATAPALVMVGYLMMKNVTSINFRNPEVGFPSFIIIIMIALTYSIATGLAFGFLGYTLIKIFLGKAKDISPIMWIISLFSLGFLLV